MFIFTVCFNQDRNVDHLYLVDTSFKSHNKIRTLCPPSFFLLEMYILSNQVVLGYLGGTVG